MTNVEPLPHIRYHGVFTSNRHVVSLTERSASPQGRLLNLSVDHHFVGEVALSTAFYPGVGIGDTHVVVWGGIEFFIVRCDNYVLTQFDQYEPVHEAYAIDHRWLLVRELSVVLADLDQRSIEETFDHDEVIVDSWWEGNRLYVEDFEHQRFAFELSDAVPRLKQVETGAE